VQRYELDFRKEARRLGIPERVGRINSIPGPAGPMPIRDADTARDALHHIRVRVAQGEPLEAVLDSFRPTGRYHVLACAERWLEHQDERARAGEIAELSVRHITGKIEKHFGRWQGVGVHEIRTRHLHDWAMDLQTQGLAPGTVRNILATMRAMMGWLKMRQEFHAVPDFPSIRMPEHAPQLLAPAQQTAVLEAIPPGRRGIFLALANLWLRPSEARALRPEVYEVVRERGPRDPAGWMTIKRAAAGPFVSSPVREWTKTRRVRTLPVSDQLAGWIAEHVPTDARVTQEFLFPGATGRMWGHKALEVHWKRACEAAKVPAVPVREGTRHSSATAARSADPAMLPLIQRMLGHANVKTTERYSLHQDGSLVRLVRE